MKRPDLTFSRVKDLFEQKMADPVTTVPELIQHLKLASYVDGTKPADKVIWLIGVADNCDSDHKEVASVAASVIAKMAEYSLDYTIFDADNRAESALRVARFLSINPACARIDGDYKKSAVKFLDSWWKAILEVKHYDGDRGLYYARNRDWPKTLALAFLNMRCWDHFQNTGMLFITPMMYAVVRKANSCHLDCEPKLPETLSWPHWDELPVLGKEWDALTWLEGESKEKLKTLVSRNPEAMLTDESAIRSLYGQLFAKSRGGDDTYALANLFIVFQHLRRKLLK